MAVNPRLRRFLAKHRVLAVDTMVFAYHLQGHPRYLPAARGILRTWEKGWRRGVTSVLSLSEILVKPLRDGDAAAAEDCRRFLTTFPNLRLLEVTRGIAKIAARLRAAHGLSLPDGIQMATALAAGATGFISKDPAFKRVPDVEVLILDEVAPARH